MKQLQTLGRIRRNFSCLWLRLTQRSFRLTVCMALALGTVLQSAHGQVLYGTLTGNITDPTGAAISRATVKAVNVDTGFNRTGQTNQEGLYKFSDLASGIYTVTIEANGFSKFQQDQLPVLVNTVQRLDATLTIGQTNQSVTVVDMPTELQTDRSDTSYTLDSQQIAELPTTSTAGRNIQSLLKLVPGSTPPAEANSAAGNPQRSQVYNINGITNTTNTTRIDGAIDAFPTLSSLTAYLPPPDGIASVNIVTGSFNAEQGSAGGAAVNITIKSGTNQFHGSVWEYNSIAQFDAQSWQNRTGIRQKNVYNEFGFSVGGPVLKDKLFFFGDWDRVTTSKAVNGIASVPTAALRSGIFLGTGTTIYDPTTGTATGANKSAFQNDTIPSGEINFAAAKMLSLLPLPNLPGQVNNYFGSADTTFIRDNIDTKITYNPSSRIGTFGHYSISPNTITDPPQFGAAGGVTWDGGQPGAATGLIQNLGLGVTYLLTPHFLLDSNAGYTRQFIQGHAPDFSLGNYGTDVLKIPGTNNGSDPNYSGIPGFKFTQYNSVGNVITSSPFEWRDNQYTGNLNGTYTRGRHSYRFGGEYLHAALNHFQPGSLGSTTPRGGFIFSGGVTAEPGGAAPNNFNSIADFLIGAPTTLGKSVQIEDPLALRMSGFSFFAQDTWQPTSALTINYGARYEYYPAPISDHYGTLRYDPSIQTSVTDATGTHTVGSVVVGGEGGNSIHAGVANHWGMIVPRIGVAYRLDAKSVIRGGFGITVDPDNLRSLLSAYPGTIGLVVNGNNSYVAAGSLTTGIPTIAIPSLSTGTIPLPYNISTYTIPKDYRRGYIESYNVTVQREIPFKLVGTISYVGSHAIRQQTLVDINGSPVGGGTAGRFLNAKYGANNNITDIYSIEPFRGSVYNGLQTQLTRTAGSLGQFGIIYTFSKSMDISDNGQLGKLNYVDPAYLNDNWALAGYDRKHNFQFWSILQSPFGKGGRNFRSSVVGYIVGGWQLSDILSRVSGSPFSVLSSAASLNAPGNTQVANRISGVKAVLNENSGGFRQYLNPQAYSTVTAVAFGNSGRNSVRGPGLFNLDISLSRSFPVWRGSALLFQAEAFDITNTPQFANPSATISTPASFGVITTSLVNRTLRLSGHITF